MSINKRKLLRLALLTSPILAIYGAMPVYLLRPVSAPPAILGVIFLSIMIGLFWLINIWLTDLGLKNGRRYLLSAVASLTLHALIIVLMPNLENEEHTLVFLIYPMIGTLAINAIILVIIHIVLLEETKKITDEENRNLRLLNVEAKKTVLQQQLQPHFLFNALSALKSLITENQRAAEDYTLKLSAFLRYSIEASEQTITTVDKELQFAAHYMSLQRGRFGDAIQYMDEVEPALRHRPIPVFAIQPLLENAIKHNLAYPGKPLLIRVWSEGNQLHISNTRNSRSVDSTGTGLKNLSTRMQVYGYPELRIDDNEQTFVVSLTLTPNEDSHP